MSLSKSAGQVFAGACAGNDLVEAMHDKDVRLANNIYYNLDPDLRVRHTVTAMTAIHYALEHHWSWMLMDMLGRRQGIDFFTDVEAYKCVSAFARAHYPGDELYNMILEAEALQRGLGEDAPKAYRFVVEYPM